MFLLFIKVSLILFSGIFTAYMFYSVWNKKLYQTFIILCFALGMAFMILIPIGIVPDEAMHSYTSYKVSNLLLGIENKDNEITMRKSDGDNWFMTSDFGSYTNEQYEAYFKSLNNETVDSSLESYSVPIVSGNDYLYIIPAIGISIGRILSLNRLQIYFWGRIFNFLLYLLGMTYVVSRAPIKKFVFFTIALLPVFLQQGISSSYDVPINIMLLIVIVDTLRIFVGHENSMHILEKAIFILCCFISCMVKFHAYILVGLLPLLCFCAKKLFGSKPKKKIIAGVCIFLVIGVIGIFVYARMLPKITLTSKDAYSVLYLLQNPKEIFAITYNTIQTFDTYFLDGFVGKYLGYLDIVMPSFVIYLYYVVLILLFVPNEKDKIKIDKKIKVVFLFISIITALFAFGGMLLANSTLQDRMVLGMQGRYLLASITLLYFVIEPKFIRINNADILFYFLLGLELLSTGWLMLIL